MDKVRVYFDRAGNTLSVWFDDPQKEHVCEESDDDMILIRDRQDRVIGFERLNFLSAEQLKKMAEINLLHVPYKGTAPALTDLLRGQGDVMFDNIITMQPHVKGGKLKLLGVGGPERIAQFPDVPAITERFPGFRSETWMGLVAPPNTPAAVAGRISGAFTPNRKCAKYGDCGSTGSSRPRPRRAAIALARVICSTSGATSSGLASAT